jgi:nickel-dependent lactate racemase
MSTDGSRLLLNSGAWYGDRPLLLSCPENWNVRVHAPRLPQPLTDDEIEERLENPVAQPPLRRLAEGKTRPLIIVDDLTRPTPADRIMPALLRQLKNAGIQAEDVRVLLASGSHGRIPSHALAKKIGQEAASTCRLLTHDYRRDLARVGRTSFGSDVLVNQEVVASDLVIGVGGVYPQHSTGFGGGSKLALGVLGRSTIVSLHYGRGSVEGSYRVYNDFRRELDEIAEMIGLRTMVSVHVDSARQIVRMVSGDHFQYYRDAVAFSVEAFRAPLPGAADVVIANAYPIDVSLTFMRSKGLTPLYHATPGASRIAISANSEGLGLHGLYPFLNGPRFDSQRQLARRITHMSRAQLAAKAVRRIRSLARKRTRPQAAGEAPRNPILLFTPEAVPDSLPAETALWHGSPERLVTVDKWAAILTRVAQEQVGKANLDVVVYPCAPLQVLDTAESRRALSPTSGLAGERP